MKFSRRLQKLLKYSLEKCPLTFPLMESKRLSKAERRISNWENAGRKGRPPEPVKHRNLLEIARKNGLKLLIETGTYHADTLYALRNEFEELHSVELSDDYYSLSRFRLSGYPHIHLHHGDSAIVLPRIVEALQRPALFWLDAHYGIYRDHGAAEGVTYAPVLQELGHIFSKGGAVRHCVAIDDAHYFGSDKNYPTIDEVEKFFTDKNISVMIRNDKELDCLSIIPQSAATP